MKELLSKLQIIRAHAIETQRLADDMIKEIESEKKRKTPTLSEEEIARFHARRMKKFTSY